jgi:hypothetical protein
MWQQFLRPDQMEVLMGKKQKGDDILIGQDAPDDEIMENDGAPSQPALDHFLEDQEAHFVEHLFAGKHKKYQKSVQKIEELENWDKATDFIEKNVFSANNVDMFSEEAIAFTDRLQSYFQEYKS